MTTTLRPAPVRALVYAYGRSASNRFRAQLRRVRSPRYIIAMAVGIAYLWLAVFRRSHFDEGPLATLTRTDLAIPILGALLLFSAARWWIFGGDRGALAFTPAEVGLLFPAPVSRRVLVHTKLVRSQIAILINTLIWSVLLRGNGGTTGGWRRGLALWILFSTLSLHRLGASIVRSSVTEHSGARRRNIVPVVIFGGLIGAVAYGVLTRVDALRFASLQGARAVVNTLIEALQQPVPHWALWPVRSLLAPVFAASSYAAWIAVLPIALVILLVHYAWVVRMDTAFEEAALEATQHRAERLQRFRTSQLGKVRSRKGRLTRVPQLSLTGRPEIAIMWKNVAAAIRGGAWRTQLVSFTIGLAFFAAISRSASAGAGDVFIGVAAGWGAMLLFVGPLWMRFDFRLDLQRLDVLKTLPIGGRGIVMAEIAGVTLLHSITVWSLMTVPLVMLLQDPELVVKSGANIPVLLAIALGVPAFNALTFTVHNATALLFPAWVRLGTETRGFEVMGQNLLTTGATALVVGVALVFPVGLGLMVILFGKFLDAWRWPIATLLGAAVVAAELWPLIGWLGKVFERLDISDVAPAP